jgi:hypothetical protein
MGGRRLPVCSTPFAALEHNTDVSHTKRIFLGIQNLVLVGHSQLVRNLRTYRRLGVSPAHLREIYLALP